MKIPCTVFEIDSRQDYNLNSEFERVLLNNPETDIVKLVFANICPNTRHLVAIHHPDILDHYGEFDKCLADGNMQSIVRRTPGADISEIEVELIWPI